MTRYPPQGQDGYQSGEQYEYSAPQQGSSGPPGGEQYGSQRPQYGGYGDYASGQAPPQYPSHQQYGNNYNGSAQSYYGSNEQAYQSYPPGPNQNTYNAPQYDQGEGFPHSSPPPRHQGYGAGSGYSPYGQQYPSGGGEVDNFRTHYDQPHGPIAPYQEPYGTYPPQQNPDDRGLMGALAGGAAGGFAGHKVNHGFLGGVGGAIAGSMLEDAYKKKHKKEKKPKSRRGSHSSSSSSSDSSDDEEKHRRHGRQAGGGVAAGNFHASSRNVRLEGHSMLVAEAADVHGHHQWSSIDLNDCFTNENGDLKWAKGGNFAATSRDIRLENDGSVLVAELGDGRGGWKHNQAYLNERITNDNGRLVLLM
nr:cyanovirin-n like [Quercus suber]